MNLNSSDFYRNRLEEEQKEKRIIAIIVLQ